jgi:hypothetical protein
MIREVLAPRVVVFFFVLWVLLTFVINSTIQLALRADAPTRSVWIHRGVAVALAGVGSAAVMVGLLILLELNK